MAIATSDCGADPVRRRHRHAGGHRRRRGDGRSGPARALPVCSAPVFGSTDGAIAVLLEAQDQAEVSLEQAVRDRLSSPAVVAFAEKMITDHTLLELQVAGSVRADSIGLVPGGFSAAVAEQENETAQVLNSLQGADSHCVYMSHEVLVHMQELALLDHLAIPDVKDVRLVADVAATQALAATHTALALQVLAAVATEVQPQPEGPILAPGR